MPRFNVFEPDPTVTEVGDRGASFELREASYPFTESLTCTARDRDGRQIPVTFGAAEARRLRAHLDHYLGDRIEERLA